jgi:Domain of unknown function (DUF4338)
MDITYCGRRFSSEDLELMRQAAHDYAALGITEIARTVCEWLDWKRPNGRLKNHECRRLLERLREEGFLRLPPLRQCGKRGPRVPALSNASDPRSPIQSSVADLEPNTLRLVDDAEGSLFRQFIQRFHYLGYRVPVGANLRYFVESGNGRILALMQWTSPAWKMSVRDQWIGWNSEQRAHNLQRIVNNSRFLILPWVQVKGLASTVLARVARQLPMDWRMHYGYEPVLIETLVDSSRFRGTCYRAANWICLGQTVGRGRMDRHHQVQRSPKLVFILPLHRYCREILRSSLTR